jgi:hypothetical protein
MPRVFALEVLQRDSVGCKGAATVRFISLQHVSQKIKQSCKGILRYPFL